MCPSVAVLAGGGDGGGGGGDGAGSGDGSGGAGAGSGGDGAGGDSRGAPDYARYPECGYASHPVDVVTGRAFTHPISDAQLPGPLPFVFRRSYSSKMASRDAGLGYGWGHSLGWEVEVQRRSVVVWTEQGTAVDFPLIQPGEESIGPFGWVLRRERWGFAVDADDGMWRIFSTSDEGERRYRLTAVEDRNRNRITLSYEGSALVEIRDSAGRTARVTPTPEGRIASIAVKNAKSLGRWVELASYHYDRGGDLTGVTDADGRSSRYEYDGEHRLTLDVDRAGMAFRFVYDDEGRCIESWGGYEGRADPSLSRHAPKLLADQRTKVKGFSHCVFEYHPGGYSEVVDSLRTRRFFGNARGLLDKRIDGAGVVTCSYDESGHLLQRTDELGARTMFERDPRGRITRFTDALGQTTTVDLGPLGLPVQIVDPAGGVTRLVRDRFGNIEQRVDPTGTTTSYRYDERGLLAEILDDHGHKTRFQHDEEGNVVAIQEPNGALTRATFDALGRPLTVTDPLGAVTRFTWSNGGDLLSHCSPLGEVTRYSYDGEGKLVEVMRPNGLTRRLTWGGYNKLCEVTDEAGLVTKITYDLDGYPVELINPKGEIHRYEHGPRGDLLAEVTFDGVRTTYRYDAAGRLIGAIDALGRRTEFVRDPLGRVIESHYPEDLVETTQYDARGDIIAAKGPGIEVYFERDAAGRIGRQTQILDGDADHVELSSHGERHVMTTSRGHRVVRAASSDHGTLRYLLGESYEVLVSLDAHQREVARRLPGASAIESVFDAVGRLAERRVSAAIEPRRVDRAHPEWIGERESGVTAQTSYRYDAEGSLVQAWDKDRGATMYKLDPIGQLLEVARGDRRLEGYGYDVNGNVTYAGGEALEYAPGDRLIAKGPMRYTYDALGRLAERRALTEGGERVWRYSWDGAQRLTAVTAPDGTRVEMRYDPFGRRVQKRVVAGPGASSAKESCTTFLWDGSTVVQEIRRSAEGSGDPIVEERSYWLSDRSLPLAHRDVRRDADGVTEGAWYHYINDPIGTPERLVDDKGHVACVLERSALGRTTPRSSSGVTTQIRFLGHYEDEETGLHYNHFRYYDPDTGRYLSPDPIGVQGGLNLFRYVRDPNSMADPFGLSPCHCVMITNNGPASRQVAPGRFAWGRTSQTDPAPAANIMARAPQIPDGTRPATARGTRGQCAEPRALTDYQSWLASQGTAPNQMDAAMQAGVMSITPMDAQGSTAGNYRAPCGFCGPMLRNMGLSNRAMTPSRAAEATGLPASTFTPP